MRQKSYMDEMVLRLAACLFHLCTSQCQLPRDSLLRLHEVRKYEKLPMQSLREVLLQHVMQKILIKLFLKEQNLLESKPVSLAQ